MASLSDIHNAIVPERKGNDITSKVPSLQVMSYLFDSCIPDDADTFTSLLDRLKGVTLEAFRTYPSRIKAPTQSSIGNCNGRWAEYMYAVRAWNTLAEYNADAARECCYVFVKLPTNSSESTVWTALLTDDIRNELVSFNKDASDPQVSGSGHEQLILYSSNPDAMILKFKRGDLPSLGLALDPVSMIGNIRLETMSSLDSIFQSLKGKIVPSENIVAFLSMKTSLRPDRRYQFVHEGDSIKAVLMYIASTRRDPGLTSSKALDFIRDLIYTISFGGVSEPDKQITYIAMSACVSSPFMGYIWAVDRLYDCRSIQDVAAEIEEMTKGGTK